MSGRAISKDELIFELRSLISRLEDNHNSSDLFPYYEEDMYCELMKEIILNTYTTN